MQTHTLLIADDSIPTQRVIQLTFATEAIRVVVAGDGHQALALIDAERPDIIFACTSVPGVDGYAIARHVSGKRHLRKIPVFLLRNGFDLQDDQKVKESRATGVLEKPLDPAVLIHCVKQALGIKAPAGEGASAPKPRKVRASSPRPRSARRPSPLPTAQGVSKRVAKSTSRPKPSARRAPRVKGFPVFEAACDPIAVAMRNETGVMTSEMLAKNVSDAVGQVVGQAIAHAITNAIAGLPLALAGIQRAHVQAPEPAIQANIASVPMSAANYLKARSSQDAVVVHGDMTTLQQLRQEMGIDDFLLDDSLFGAAGPGEPAHLPVDISALTMAAFSPSTPSLDTIHQSAAIEREPADVLGDWAEELKWLAAEIGTTRVAPDAGAPDSSRDFGTGVDNRSPWALPARVGAWLGACDIRPGLASFTADTMAALRLGTAQLLEPFRGGQLRVWTSVVWLAGASAVLKAIGRGY